MRFFAQFRAAWWVQACLALTLVCVPLALPRFDWTVDAGSRPDLRQIEVVPGYRVTMQDVETDSGILSYSATSGHMHRVELDLQNAKVLNIASNLLLKTGRYTLAPDRESEEKAKGNPCLASIVVQPKIGMTAIPMLSFWPARADEAGSGLERTVHVKGSELEVRFSANGNGKPGPGCYYVLLTPDAAPYALGPNIEIRFSTEQVALTLTPEPASGGEFHSGADPFEALSIELLRPKRLLLRYGDGSTSPVRDLRRAVHASFAVERLALGRRDLQFTLSGPLAIPIPKILGAWTRSTSPAMTSSKCTATLPPAKSPPNAFASHAPTRSTRPSRWTSTAPGRT